MRADRSRNLPGALLALALLGGCAGYTYTLNERTMFEGPKLFDGYDIADASLRDCVAQAIHDAKISSADALEDLNCSSAGIADLSGIDVFTGLRRLGLDGNAIADISPLYALKKLELLQLRGNALQSAGTQLCAGATRQVALAGNKGLACSDVAALEACGVTLIDRPAHCSGD